MRISPAFIGATSERYSFWGLTHYAISAGLFTESHLTPPNMVSVQIFTYPQFYRRLYVAHKVVNRIAFSPIYYALYDSHIDLFLIERNGKRLLNKLFIWISYKLASVSRPAPRFLTMRLAYLHQKLIPSISCKGLFVKSNTWLSSLYNFHCSSLYETHIVFEHGSQLFK